MPDYVRRFGLLALLAVAACGGDDDPPFDAPNVDAPLIDAADIDAPQIDAPVIDAPPPIDAPVIDAPPPIDAPVIDAPPPIDAPVIDAPPPIDAPVIDAPPPIDAPVIDAPPPIDAPVIDAPPPIDAPTDAAPGASPYLAIEPSFIDLGAQEIGQPPPTRDVIIRNVGGQTTGVVLSTSNSALVVVQNDCLTLDPMQTCTARVRMDLNTPGTFTHDLRAIPLAGGNIAIAPVRATAGHRVTVDFRGLGGTVTSLPAGVNCTDDCSGIVAATTVSIHAEPAPGHGLIQLRTYGPPPQCAGDMKLPDCTVPLSGPLTFHVTFGLPLTIQQTGTGAGQVYVDGPDWYLDYSCSTRTCPYYMPVGSAVSVYLMTPTYEGSSLTAWGSPCSGTGTCAFVMTGATVLTANFLASPPQVWIRADESKVGLAIVADATGLVVGGSYSSSIWLARYDSNGELLAQTTSVGNGYVRSLAADGSGGFYALIGDGANLTLRRHTDLTTIAWSMPAPDTVDIGSDAAGNVYVATTHELRSYDAAGALRWQVSTTNDIRSMSVRGGTIGVGGWSGASAWIAAYNLAGTLQWQHSVAGFAVEDVAVNATGSVYFLQRTSSGYALNTASAGNPPPVVSGGSPGTRAWLAMRPNGTAAILLMNNSGAIRLLHQPNGLPLRDGAGFDIDPSGNIFLAGRGSALPAPGFVIRTQ